jgi:hypothetical protein
MVYAAGMPRGGRRPNSGGRRPGAGRKTVYREELAQLVLAGMAAGETSIAVCRKLGLPDTTVGQWRADDRNGFRGRYVQAFAARAHGFAEEILQVLDDVPPGSDIATVTLAMAKADALKWLASRLVPQLADSTPLPVSQPVVQ